MDYRMIRATYDENTITVYQAYNNEIAKEAVQKGTFGSLFKMNRTTWIKPSFLWMMYRSGWATKKGQERVLAIKIKRDAFDFIVQNSVMSIYDPEIYDEYGEWKKKLKKSDVICQWDPERDIYGQPLNYRTIQLGLRGNAVYNYVNDWIVDIEDITSYVEKVKKYISLGVNVDGKLPKEIEYKIF